MKIRLRDPRIADLPQAGERVRLTDGRIARVTKVTTRWESEQDTGGYRAAPRLLQTDLTLVPDAKRKA